MSTEEAWLSEVHHAVSDAALDTLFREAHTTRKWLDRKVSPAVLMAIYDLMRWGPTATNITPARIVFVMSPEAKARLKPHLDAGNVRQSMEAPVTAILGYDLDFARHLPRLYRDNPKAQSWFTDTKANEVLALRNGSLQGGYFILAARALGLDCGPMGGFNHAGIDAEFFAGAEIKSNFLCNLGYGAPDGFRPRNERLAFDEACQII
ncbi:MAG TPA: malonic semialdehyde reductase [Rhizomicrobium sp.]|nr:malonic semialdehyde reductase [Rhizomicrobium sp.]